MVRNVTVLRGKSDFQRARAIIANALLLALAISAIGAILVGTLSGFLLREIIVPPDLHGAIPALLGAAIVLFCCEQLSSVAEGVLLGAKQYLASEAVRRCGCRRCGPLAGRRAARASGRHGGHDRILDTGHPCAHAPAGAADAGVAPLSQPGCGNLAPTLHLLCLVCAHQRGDNGDP
ncbi:MAG: hypothetical protein C4345_04890 [Chloroflexota bacterium]